MQHKDEYFQLIISMCSCVHNSISRDIIICKNMSLALATSFHLKVTCSSQSCSFNHLIVDLSPSIVKLLSKSSRLIYYHITMKCMVIFRNSAKKCPPDILVIHTFYFYSKANSM